jgi:hypothetical protein
MIGPEPEWQKLSRKCALDLIVESAARALRGVCTDHSKDMQ